MKKILSGAFLCVCVCLCIMRVFTTVEAAEIDRSGTCGENLIWTQYDDGTLVISGTGLMSNYSVIPTPDSPWSMNSNIHTIKIEEGVTSIGRCAFGWMFGLKKLYIPSSVTVIGSDAFNNSLMVDNIYYAGTPSDWNNIRIDSGNYVLDSARMYYGVGDGAAEKNGDCGPQLRWSLSDDGVLVISGTGRMDDYAGGGDGVSPWYAYKSIIKKIIIENGVTSTGYCAFWECTKIMSVSLPDTLTSIGDYSFALCTSLPQIEIPASVTDIGFSAFGACYALTSIEVPAGIVEIKGQTFAECSGLKSITIPSGITGIGDTAFWKCPGLMDVYFGGTKEQWEAVRIGDENDSLRDATIHFGSSANGLDEDKKYKVFRMGGYESFDISLEDCMGKEASSVYNPQLAHILIAMCNAVNDDSDMSKTFYSFGMQEQERIGGLFLTYSMGRKDLGNGEKLVLIAIRGTKDFLEGVSNFDAFINSNGEHTGFSDASQELRDKLEDFLGTDDYSNTCFVITGFSRGAAVGNILSKDLMKNGVREADLYSYNFACPDVGHVDEDATAYRNIFNVANATDLISWSPRCILGNRWGKYGKSLWFSENWNDYQNLEIGMKAHDETKYLAFLREESDSGFKRRSEAKDALDFADLWRAVKSMGDYYVIGEVIVACPVDVEVYVSGNLVGEVKNNEPLVTDASKVSISTMGREKKIYLLEDDTYSFKLSATGSGTMTYSVANVDVETGTAVEKQTFEQVALVPDKQFSSTVVMDGYVVSDFDGGQVKLYVVDEDGELEKEVLPDGSGTERPLSSEMPDESDETDVPTTIPEPAPGSNAQPAPDGLDKGDTVVVGEAIYELTSDETVAYVTPSVKAEKVVTIPAVVMIDGRKFKVTAIAAGAFKNERRLKKVTIGKHVTKIGTKAFKGAKALKKIVIKSKKLKIVGKNAFKGISKKAVMEVPEKQLKLYKKLLKGKGQPKTAKIRKRMLNL